MAPLGAREAADDPATEALHQLKDLENPEAGDLARILPLMADPSVRNDIRAELLRDDGFPAAALIENLGHPKLAVRLGALELLEERAGGDFDFNPWLSPGTVTNEGPLTRWGQWAETDTGGGRDGSLLDEAQRRGYLRALLSDDSDKAARARHMLQADGLASVGFLENFLSESPNLPAGSRTKIRQAQYQIVLTRAFGEQSSEIARNLAFGSRDQMLSALGSLRSAGFAALPILRGFLDHSDPLVRESAIDAMLASGGAQTLPVIAPALKAETDVNVIHGALRRLKDVSGDESVKLAAGFLDHEDEDLLVSAIQTCLVLVGGNQSFFGSSDSETSTGVTAEVNQAVIRVLDSPSWRVRTAALEFITGRRVGEAKEKVVELLDDPDEFVRFQAIKAAGALKATKALPKLKTMFLAGPEMVGPVLEGYGTFGKQPDEEMLKALDGYPPDARLSVVRAAESNSSLAPIVLRFASDPDLDVACAALRFLGADDDRVEDERIATALLKALQEGSAEKRAAVLDRLAMPKTETLDPAMVEVLGEFAESPEKTSLDPLYDAFLQVEGGEATRAAEALPGALGKLAEELLEIARSGGDGAFRPTLILASAGHPDALALLSTMLPELSTARQAAIAENLHDPSQREALEVLRQLLRKPVSEIRAAAAQSAFSNEDAPAFAAMVLEELGRPEAVLRPHEIYNYSFNYAARSGRSASVVRNWAIGTLSDDEASGERLVLALVALRDSGHENVRELAVKSPSPWVRRAAFHTLGRSSLHTFRELLPELTADDMPQVRAVLPEITGRMASRWEHRFTDSHGESDNSYDSSRDSRTIHDATSKALEEMAQIDPSPENRFEANFALLSHGREIDIEAFAALIARQPEEAHASRRLAGWMNDNLSRLGPGLAPILTALDTSRLSPKWIQQISQAVGGASETGSGFASFSALVEREEEARTGDQQLKPVEPVAEEVPRESLQAIYFFKPGCRDCTRVSDLLDSLESDFPLLEVIEHNILDGPSTVLNQALCDRFGVPATQQNVAPSIFVQAGFLVGDNIVPSAMGSLLAETMKQPEDDAWRTVDEGGFSEAREHVEERYKSLTLPIVIGAGLLDGVNPCAFATIIFFLSYLQVARRTPREMLMVGAAFILAVFLAYLAAGLALHRVLATLTEHVQGIQKWLNGIFGILALLAAILSARDAVLAHRGRAEEMTLQLPAFLKTRIRGVIRTGARARRFVIAAFLAGIVISFLELACTGQVYAPIIYQIQQGRADAVGMLILYNLAFILPLVVIFIAVWAGLRSETLIRIQKQSTAAVKILLATLFLALAVIMLLGDRILPY